ncbi:MAG: hypothetical protein ACKPKO_26700 [Candidatus Fonsibacter sp.]
MMERQKVVMLSAIARSSDLTMTQLKILNKRKPIPDAATKTRKKTTMIKSITNITI